MPALRPGLSLALSFLLAACAGVERPGPNGARGREEPAPMHIVMRRLAVSAGFDARDFDLLVNYPGRIPKSLPVVERLLRNPALSDSLVPALRRDLSESARTDFAPAGKLWAWLGVSPHAGESPRMDRIPGSATAGLRDFIRPLNPQEQAFILRELPELIRAREDDTLLNPVEREIERLRGDAVTDSVMHLAGKLRMEALARSAELVEELLRMFLHGRDPAASAMAAATRLRDADPDNLSVVIGTKGPDTHRLGDLERGVIVFDPGGDDRYEFPESPRPGSWLLIIDMEGNDEYLARDSVGGAAAFLSVQVIADLKGNDRYSGLDFAFGSALLGYSRLYDASGDDRYEARCASLGFAFHGIGILEDVSGNDVYSTAFFSQGAASTKGLGVLVDHAGDDRYVSRPVYPDDLRYRDHFLSMSQGFSSGFAPRHAGGIGALWDRGGNDAYVSDIFGQGTGYWFAWGLLMDDAGDDRFTAYQYAQGAGVHFAVGSLLDASGNDVRVSKGVSQGCGHDGGFGLLLDVSGNDSTTAVDMSAGAGSANGLGVYLDLSGNDAYRMGNPLMTLGHGDMRRDRGSFGFFLDLGGKDAYPDSAGLGDGRSWRVYDGKKRGEGYGMDGSR